MQDITLGWDAQCLMLVEGTLKCFPRCKVAISRDAFSDAFFYFTTYSVLAGGWLFSVGKWLFSVGKWLFSVGKWLFSFGKRLFSVGKWLFSVGKWLFSVGKRLFSVGKWLFSFGKRLFSVGKWLFSVGKCYKMMPQRHIHFYHTAHFVAIILVTISAAQSKSGSTCYN